MRLCRTIPGPGKAVIDGVLLLSAHSPVPGQRDRQLEQLLLLALLARGTSPAGLCSSNKGPA
jgi:hypothetical protein